MTNDPFGHTAWMAAFPRGQGEFGERAVRYDSDQQALR
jgi:hypothetical protein